MQTAKTLTFLVLNSQAEDLQTIGDVLRASSSETDAKSVKNTSWVITRFIAFLCFNARTLAIVIDYKLTVDTLYQTRQFHDKSRQSKAINVQPESNLKEMNKCKCGKDKALMKAGAGGSGVAGQKASAAALVMPFHAHHPLIMGYKPLTSTLKTPNASSAASSCQSSRSVTPSSSADAYLPTLPVRSDSLTNLEEEELLKCAPWFQAGIPR